MSKTSRREFLKTAAGLSACAIAVGDAETAQAQPLRPTPACPGSAPPTERQTEGPYFKPDSPLRASLLEPGMTGTKIVVTGMVLSTTCQPVARALLDVWHADDQGRYRLETIVPGIYVGRTRHFHVKVQAPGRPVLTTQLYFPGEAVNARDPIFSRDLVMQVRDAGGDKAATFDFVLDLGRR